MKDAFICDAVRTPFGRFGGALAPVRADDLAALPLRALRERNPGVDWEAVDDVILGCANQAGEDNRNVARMALLLAGLPVAVTGVTVNRLCGSGLDSVVMAARSIKAGEADLLIAGGVESMSRAPYVLGKATAAFSRAQQLEDSSLGWRFVNPRMQARYGTHSMPETAENLAVEYSIPRGDQDAYALRSQRRTAAAQAAGWLAQEIVPVELPRHRGEALRVAVDEHPRPDTTPEQLAALKPIVTEGGTITAGNASGLNDGAGALLIASESALGRHGLRPLARIAGAASAGVEPRIMGLAPAPAIDTLLAREQVTLERMDLIELNEAFAAQVLAVTRQLGLADDDARINPNGGAIALGHPLGASGARLVGAAVNQLQRGGGRYGVCAMCIGVGQGLALLLERA